MDLEVMVSGDTENSENSTTEWQIDDIAMDSNFFILMTSLISAMIWIIYITYYNSRVMGFIFTKVLNRLYVRDGFLHVGSITWNVLSGKIMCRDVTYITNDYTVRVQDGWLIFRWWRSYVPKDVSEDLSHSDTRLSVMLNGFELHVYNRCMLYAHLEEVFGLEPQMFAGCEKSGAKGGANEPALSPAAAAARSHSWRDLVPVVKLDVESGRVVFGNRLVPTTLSIAVEEAHFVYSTKPAASRLDHFMHFAKCKAENFKVILAPSPKYTGMVDEPPRFMGEGLVALSSNNIELYYYMDEAGAVPEQPEMLRLANGDIVESAPPIWGMDIKCGKGTDFSYGPWADRQRERLLKFFFPADCQPLKVTKAPQPGEKRMAQCFDIRLSTLNEATVDILFSKNKETSAVHINVGPGSYLEVNYPWVVTPEGFTTKITGQLLHLEATTSLQFRSLVESETLEFNVRCHYPIEWNAHQEWLFNLTGCKATVHLIFAHKWFFQDLINDWSSKARPDLLHFVPYTWKMALLLKEFEVIIPTNEYNWIDCSSQNQENVFTAFAGDLFDLSFDLPFCDFLPDTIPLRFWLQGESVALLLCLPETNTCRPILLALDENARTLGRDGQPVERTPAKRWRNKCMRADGWVDCWTVQIIALCINYTYHPCPPLGPPPQADITTPEKEEMLLSPIRMPHCPRKSPAGWRAAGAGGKFEPTSLPPDKVSLELEMGPSVVMLYGTLIRNFLHLKENIFGDDQVFTDMQQSMRPTAAEPAETDVEGEKRKEFDARDYRPLDVNVSITMHDLQAHLVKNCAETDPPCPMILLERFGFEMKKAYKETQLQLLLSPAILLISDQVPRSHKEKHLSQGHLLLSGLQIRDHAMFSNEGRTLDDETLEYGWLLEVHLGKLSGKLTAPQTHHLVTALETFALLVLDSENHLRSPGVTKICHHGLAPLTCPESDAETGFRCPAANDIKYRMNRVLVDALDLYVLEAGTAIHLWASPLRLSTCNLHGHNVKSGVTAMVPTIRVRQFVSTGGQYGGQSGGQRHSGGQRALDGTELWLEAGAISLGPVVVEAATSLPPNEHALHAVQQAFLRLHDAATRRLWFLWPKEAGASPPRACGCVGGCAFFGTNRNGARFFQPTSHDLVEGVNTATFRVSPAGQDPGFGQSLLHDGQLVFHAPPYAGGGADETDAPVIVGTAPLSWDAAAQRHSSLRVARQDGSSSRISTASPSPGSCYGERRNLGRRFSYTSIGTRTQSRDVPYSRLVDHSPTQGKIESDSRLDRSVLGVPEAEAGAPKSSLSDSRLAVDYFGAGPVPTDSRQSLASPADESRANEVQRTVSMSSENPSDTFYSADEDVLASRTSSLRNSVTLSKHETIAVANRGKFASELSILPGGATTPAERLRLSSHRSDHEIHTPEHRQAEPARHSSRDARQLATGIDVQEIGVLADSSDTHSVSSTSFISAVSSQDDVTLVNLHAQCNKPIVDSPVLVASYVHHLSQVGCSNWASTSLPPGCDGFTLPLFRRTDDGRLVYVGGRYTPRFETLTEGFTSLKMVERIAESPAPSRPAAAHPLPMADAHGTELLAMHRDAGTRTTVVVRLDGDVDVMASPLALESLQRFVDALAPTLASRHPLSVVNHLRLGCVSQVQAANVLKRDQSLSYLGQLGQTGSKRGTAERLCSLPQEASQLQPGSTYQESISTQLQGTLILSKLNVTLLQASVVEEVISFSALDNLRDLTCVSLFAVCLDGITARFHRGKTAREVVETFHRPAVLPTGQKKGGKLKSASTADTIGGEPVYIETSETQREETVLSLSVSRVHAQLRRLRNESSVLKDAVITAIPAQHSKVLFTCARVPSLPREPDVYAPPEPVPPQTDQSAPPAGTEDHLGFIMVEIGLEGVSLKVVKRSQFEKADGEKTDIELPAETDRAQDSVRSRDEIIVIEPEPAVEPGPSPRNKPTNDGPDATDSANQLVKAKDGSNTSSCVIELRTVWFNFAAPPRAPITRKLDFTRLDWNLLSTASPAINAWMNPSNRFAIRVVFMFRGMHRRSTAIVACLMADALDLNTIHMPIKSRYGRYTPLAKTLQEDPSCQLCNVLHKFVLQSSLAELERGLRDPQLPALTTLRQGVIVLSRQWKNILYTPLLLDHNYKRKRVRPLNITFAARETDEENAFTDGENSGDDCEPSRWFSSEEGLALPTAITVTDECAMLIGSRNAAQPPPPKKSPPQIIAPPPDGSQRTSPSPSGRGKKRQLAPSQPPASSRASIVFPVHAFAAGRTREAPPNTLPYAMLKDPALGSNTSLYSAAGGSGSGTSLDHVLSPSGGGANASRAKGSPAEDLYSWMAKQPDFARHETNETTGQWEAKLSTLSGADGDGSVLVLPPGGFSLYPMHDSLRLLDAHLIFEPLLSCLGVVPRQMMSNLVSGPGSPSAFDSWGTTLSLVGGIDTMRIDIVVSESGKTSERKKGKNGKSPGGKFLLELPAEAPAFLCEKMVVELDLKKVADMTVDDLIHKQKVLYVSRGQLKKHTSTTLNIGLNVRYISQQVNMPLLRLLHQISNMYQNVKETQMELREQQPGTKLDLDPVAPATVDNTAKNGSSTSDLQERLSVAEDKPKAAESTLSDEDPLSLSQTKMASPTASLRARPQSFAQKLRSTSKSVKGYMNLSDGSPTPAFPSGASPGGSEHLTLTSEREATAAARPRCWQTVYYLLDLYASMPETKTITHRFSVAGDVWESGTRGSRLADGRSSKEDVEASTPGPGPAPGAVNVVAGERTRLIVFGVARIHRTRLLATLSGLKLEAEITSLHSSLTCRKKSRPASLECSLTGQVGRTMIVLLEGVAPNQQTVVRVTVGKSQALYSSISRSRRAKDKNSGLLTVGAVSVDIPQHPVALHGMMTRGSKQLSSTLQELRVTRSTSRSSRPPPDTEGIDAAQRSPHAHQPRRDHPGRGGTGKDTRMMQPLVMQFNVVLASLSVTAALLPSLQAQYKMDQVTSAGVTGGKAKFTVDLPRHSLSFNTRLVVAEANLPSEASIELPKVHVSAEYVADGSAGAEALFADGVVLRQGSYLSAVADIGVFEHSLTTDLLNHLVFVQKVFMREVNEVVQKVYGGEKPVALWEDDGADGAAGSMLNRVLFSLVIRVRRIQLTATTPTSSAVRLETGAVEFQLSNRVQNVSVAAQPNPYMKIFGKAQVDVNLSLGQLIKNVMFEEAEPEFQQFAFFKTRIGLRNAFQDEMVQGDDKEVVLITLKRPLIYIQPMAVDKAILVWLNYKNAYEYWNEQRSGLNKEVLTATQQVLEKVPFGALSGGSGGPPHLGTLFLQLTVEDMGICLPLNPLPLAASWHMSRPVYETESRNAVVITLENTSISACSSGSLVSKGRFVGLCLRFADDFETSLDDWKPDMSDGMMNMNLCVVSDGTYEVCSRTLAHTGADNAKWFLNVAWQMEGVDIHLDVNVGKQLSALGHTLTMLTGSLEEEDSMPPWRHASFDSDDVDVTDGADASLESISARHARNVVDSLPAFVMDPTLDAKKRSKLIEKEMNEQAKIINDLRTLGASYGTIEQEMKRLHELEAMVFKDFRRDMIQKLRRQSVKASSIKGKFGLGSKSSTFRSRSFVVPSPTPEHASEGTVGAGAGGGSVEGSPASGPSRAASLRVRHATSHPRVTFAETRDLPRQTSLASAGSELSLPETEWDGEEDDGVELRRRDSPLDAGVSTSPPYQKPQEPNIDFELDVKVLVNRGKCVLHTKDPGKEDELKLSSRMKKERSCSGGMFDFAPGSPGLGRRAKPDAKTPAPAARLRYLHGSAVAQLVDLTIFHIPGLDVKVHYESKTLEDESKVDVLAKKTGTKKASLFAWMTLQSIPEETVISPHILEFLEQTLEPIPAAVKPTPPAAAMIEVDASASAANYVYASFPVDVIVYFHMQPSTFRFSCLPVSRVECMLQLPSLDIVFSSKRAEEDTPLREPDVAKAGASAVGGLSVTGCLADFSVYIFHPYGGGKKSAHKEAQWSPLTDSERKDSLSVNVEFVKFHLSRSRKLNFPADGAGKKAAELSQAVIRFSTLVDIGSASFKYDMRRLTEILAFPKAWYRRSIVRRLFLGDLSFSAAYSDTGDNTPSSAEEELLPKSSSHDTVSGHSLPRASTSGSARSPMATTRDRLRLSLDADVGRTALALPQAKAAGSAWETLVLFGVNFTKLNLHMNMGNVMGNVVWLTKDFRSDGRLSIGSTGHKNMYVGVGLGGSSLDAKGGIVGGTIELSRIDTFVHIREDPGTEPGHTLGLKLFALELRLDYMGTGVLMARVSTLAVSLRDEWKIQRRHEASDIPTRRPAMIFMHGDLGWDQLQLMISKSTTADLLKMFYKLDEFFSQQFKSSKRVFSSLQPRGSSLRRKKKSVPAQTSTTDGAGWPSALAQDARHHRHWQRVLYQVAGLHLSTLRFPLPLSGTVLGGTMELHGNNISLACFHGINFKSKSWALFSLKEPCISFATEAQEVPTTEGSGVGSAASVHVVQTLTFGLGMAGTAQAHAQHHSMAAVCRISRNELFPPQFRALHEWFHYAFSNSEMDSVDRFPFIEREPAASAQGSQPPPRKPQDPNHTREVIFALPSLQLHLKTEHLQAPRTPDAANGQKPLVECSFITEFEDHIFVTVDAEAFFFLHDLITSYVREKERVSNAAAQARAQSPDHERRAPALSPGTSATPSSSVSAAAAEEERKRKLAFDPAEMFTKDWRNYHCKTWHLEPTVRLLSWAGKSIEPYGIDYILQKLGFSHASTTIPKWMQRGFMDPLDKVLAVLMLRIVAAVRDGPRDPDTR